MNEDTLWSGAPRDWNNPGAKQHLAEVRRLVLEQEDYVGADRECHQMQGPYNESYLPAGESAYSDGARRRRRRITGASSIWIRQFRE